MADRPRGRIAALALCLTLALLTALAASVVTTIGGAPRAFASARSASVDGLQIRLTAITPIVAGPTDSPTVSGTVLNGGATASPAGELRVMRGLADLSDTAGVNAWSTSSTTGGGVLLGRTALPGIPAGESATFSLTLPAAGGLTREPYDVLPITLEFGDAITHTFLGIQRAREYESLALAWVVPLTIDPDPALFATPSADRVAAWEKTVGPQSRIARLVSSFTGTGIGYAVDADLIAPQPLTVGGAPSGPSDQSASPTATPSASPSPSAPSTAPSNAPSTAPSASPSPSPSATNTPPETAPDLSGLTPLAAEQAVRAAAGRRLVSQLSASSPWVLPAGDPDLAALPAGVRPTGRLESAEAAARLVSGRADVVWPAESAWSPEASERYAGQLGAAPGAVIVGRGGLAWNVAQGDAGRRAVDGTPLLANSERLVAAVDRAVRVETAGVGRQEFLALTMAHLRESPGLARTVLLALPRGLDPDPASVKALLTSADQIPWLGHTTPTAVLAQAGSAPARTEPVSDVAADPLPSPLGDSTWKALTSLQERANGAAQIRADRDLVLGDWERRLAALDSTRWRGRADAFDQVLVGVDAEVANSVRSVRVAPQTINFLADRGRLQVTVFNDLAVEVEGVRVQLVPDNPRLRITTPVKEVTIGALSRTTVTYEASALAAGPVRVEARVTGPSGVSVGPTTMMDVRVSPTGNWIYVLLGGLAVLALALGLWRSRAAARRRIADGELPPNAIQVDETGTVMERAPEGGSARGWDS